MTIGKHPDQLRYFDTARYQDKPELLRIFQPFADLAALVAALPEGSQRSLALDHLLIAKDAAVRAGLPPA